MALKDWPHGYFQGSGMSWKREADEIAKRRELAKQLGGPESVKRQHDKGRLTIRERIEALLDADSFEEVGTGAGEATLWNDGALETFTPANFVLGFGQIDGRRCIVGGEDFTLKGGPANQDGVRPVASGIVEANSPHTVAEAAAELRNLFLAPRSLLTARERSFPRSTIAGSS